jgi:hypothetical protein
LPLVTADAAPLAPLFAAQWRRRRIDILAALILLGAASFAAGQVWRFPFDDELLAMVPRLPPTLHQSAWDIAWFYLRGGNIHPPLPVLYFSGLYRLGVGEPAMRLGSLAMTALASVLWQLVALALVERRRGAPADPLTRLIAVLLFGLSPLAIGCGDAIRWYPQFSLCVALFATSYLAGRNSAARLASAIPLGLAVSVNLIAPLVIGPFVIYRYLLERARRASFDIAYWLLFAVFATPGLYTGVNVLRRKLGGIWVSKCGYGPLSGLVRDVLGVFGGNALGVGEGWVIAPVAAITAVAAVMQIEWRDRASPSHLPLLILAATLPTAFAGCTESRMFLYLAPILAVILVAFFGQLAMSGATGRSMLLAAFAVLPGLVAIGELRSGTHPYRRDTAVPFGEIVDFIDRNESGGTLVVSTDPVVIWELGKRTDAQRCLSFFFENKACFADSRQYRSVFVVSGYSDRSRQTRLMQWYAERIGEIVGGRDKIAELPVGHDEDAMLKTRLTGIPRDEFILTVDLYR